MNSSDSFQSFFTSQSVSIPIVSFMVNILIVALLSYILNRVYIKYGEALSSRRAFANNFILIAMTTMLIISIVKSSLALSLGLVGALSIIRFRAAIKEPEELAYLFLCIALGLGMGADQTLITVIAFIIIVAIIIIKSKGRVEYARENYYLSITSSEPQNVAFKDIIDTIKKCVISLELKRIDETGDRIEVSVLVEIDSYDAFKEMNNEIKALNPNINLTFMDSKGIL